MILNTLAVTSMSTCCHCGNSVIWSQGNGFYTTPEPVESLTKQWTSGALKFNEVKHNEVCKQTANDNFYTVLLLVGVPIAAFVLAVLFVVR